MSGCGCGSYGGSFNGGGGGAGDMSSYFGMSDPNRITRWSQSVTTVESIPFNNPFNSSRYLALPPSRPTPQYRVNNNYLAYGDDSDSDSDDDAMSSYSSFAGSASGSSRYGGNSTMSRSRSSNFSFGAPSGRSSNANSSRFLAVEPSSYSQRSRNKSRCCSSNY